MYGHDEKVIKNWRVSKNNSNSPENNLKITMCVYIMSVSGYAELLV